MQTFLNLSASQSKGLDNILFKNSCCLKKDALLIIRHNQSFSRSISLMVLSLEETIKAILIKLHSEGLNIYKLPEARKFFKDHKIRHQIAQLIEMGGGIFQSYENWTTLKINRKFPVGSFFDGIAKFINAGSPVIASIQRIHSLDNFNNYKNNGFYVGYADKLFVPDEFITAKEFQSVQDILERTQRFYKTLRIIYHPKLENRNDFKQFNKKKEDLKLLVNQVLQEYNFPK